MANVGDIITASLYNAFNTQVNTIWSVGFGERGYGQTSPVLTSVVTGDLIGSTGWTNIRNALSSISTFQGTALTLPTTGQLASGQPVMATHDFTAAGVSVDANRFNNNNGASMVTTFGSLIVTRNTIWGTGNSSIICEVSASFANENAARYFFNSSGTLNVVMSHPNGSSPQDVNWRNLLANLGTISLGAKATTRSGTGGIPIARGFYNLTGSYQVIFDGNNIGTGAYAANDVVVEALVQNVTGVNGGNGTLVRIKVTLTDQHTNGYYDYVTAGTLASFGFRKAVVGLTGIASPSYVVNVNF